MDKKVRDIEDAIIASIVAELRANVAERERQMAAKDAGQGEFDISAVEDLWLDLLAKTRQAYAEMYSRLLSAHDSEEVKKKERALKAGNNAMRNGGKQEKTLITRVGELTLRRTVLKRAKKRCTNRFCKAAVAHEVVHEVVPLDDYLRITGLPFKVSPLMLAEIAYWGQNQGSYHAAEQVLQENFGVSVTDTVVAEITASVGGRVFAEDTRRAAVLAAKPEAVEYPRDKKGVCYLMLDGAAINTRKRDAQGSSWRENKLAMIFTDGDIVRRPNKRGEEERQIKRKTYVSYGGNVEGFKGYVYEAAVKAGCFQYKDMVIISDGAAWIRNMGEELFPDAVQILDFYHLAENIYGFGKYLYKGDEKQYKPWADELIGLLKESKTAEVLEKLKAYEGKTYGAGVVNPHTYLKNNLEKVDYAAYKKRGWYRGSGPVESGNKTVLQKRCKQAGMRWNVPTAQTLLTLRAKQESGLWKRDVVRLLMTS